MPLAGKLIPGWAIALLAIALLAPVAIVSVDGLARASRRGEALLPAAAWLLSRMIPFIATALLAYLMALIGLIPDPSFPFDPSRYRFGVRGGGGLACPARRLRRHRPLRRPVAPAGGGLGYRHPGDRCRPGAGDDRDLARQSVPCPAAGPAGASVAARLGAGDARPDSDRRRPLHRRPVAARRRPDRAGKQSRRRPRGASGNSC